MTFGTGFQERKWKCYTQGGDCNTL